mgnify:CR=1 FL=1
MEHIFCPKCGKQIDSRSKYCLYCGADICDFLESKKQSGMPPKPEEQPTTKAVTEQVPETVSEIQPEAKSPKKNRTLAIFCVAAAITIAIAFAVSNSKPKQKTDPTISAQVAESATAASETNKESTSGVSNGKTSSSSSGTSSTSKEIKAGVYTLAEKCIKKHLKSPSSAKICSMSDCEFQKGEDGVYTMAGTVESQNGYGATIQEVWGIMAQVDGEKVSLIMLQIGDNYFFD